MFNSFYFDFKFIKLVGNTILLMVNGFTFAKANQRHWYCSKKTKGCKARVILSNDGTFLNACRNTHNHDPPAYAQLSSGLYVRISG
ncbi:unnamed protein product [Euphydryas editha]|uniref:FLYWCH-type domain-containing protein n=1 Tax=Euphydryas editha TaxID=104508 RepID=A0AAU9TFJ4_EUPED|nr:unnamed protein product [Euphydryas editha]